MEGYLMFTFATTQSSITKLWRDGFSFYKNTFTKIWYLTLAVTVTIWILQIAGAVIPTTDLNLPFSQIPKRDILILVVLTLVSFLTHSYFIGLLYTRIYNLGKHKHVSLIKDMQVVRSRFFALCGIILLMACIVILGMLALVIPGIFMAYLFMFSVPLVICENYSIWRALGTSAKLVWGNWWRTFWVMIPIAVFFYSVYGLDALLVDKIYRGVIGIANIIFFTLFGSLIYTFILVQFNDLQLRKKK